MTEAATACSHGLDKTAFRGMRTVEVESDTVTFECPSCGLRQVAMRCTGITKSGERCRIAAATGLTACRMHRQRVAVAQVVR